MSSTPNRSVRTVEELTAEEEERLKPLRWQDVAFRIGDLGRNYFMGSVLAALGIFLTIYGLLAKIEGALYVGLFCLISGLPVALHFRGRYRRALQEFRQSDFRKR